MVSWVGQQPSSWGCSLRVYRTRLVVSQQGSGRITKDTLIPELHKGRWDFLIDSCEWAGGRQWVLYCSSPCSLCLLHFSFSALSLSPKNTQIVPASGPLYLPSHCLETLVLDLLMAGCLITERSSQRPPAQRGLPWPSYLKYHRLLHYFLQHFLKKYHLHIIHFV